MNDRLTSRLSIKCFTPNALDCLACYTCRGFTDSVTIGQIFKDVSPSDFVKTYLTKVKSVW